MKRSLILAAALVAVAGIATAKDKAKVHCDGKNAFVLRMDGTTFANGIDGGSMDVVCDRYGKRFAYFAREGRKYVIRDLATLDRLEAIYSPQAILGTQQGSLGTKQAALGTQQAAIGMEQARIGMEQARNASNSDSARYQELVRRQNELSEKQNELGRKQDEMGRKQSALGSKQEEAAREAEQKVKSVLDEAIRRGTATEVH
jgi:hypothetical protein